MPTEEIPTFSSAIQNEIILDSLSDGVCRISLTGRILYSNRAAERILGFGEKELNGKDYTDGFFSKSRESYFHEVSYCPIQFVLDSGETSHVSSETFVGSDGADIRVEYICTPLFEKDDILGAVISFQDIAEQYEAERILSEARDMALQAAESKAMFLANMSHEIRTPLNGIIGITDLLSDSKLSNEQNEYVRMLKTSTKMLRGIVDDILNFSKIESGILELENIEFSPAEMAKEATAFFAPLAREKEIGLDHEIDKDITPILIGDANKLRQIINNLLSNAIKFTASGGVKLKISSIERNESQEELRFEVSDTGIGVSKDSQANLFQPFTQADESTTRIYGGTGLGLAICRKLVETMGGRIGFESKYRGGSLFWFSVNLRRSQSAEGRLGLGLNETERDSGAGAVRFSPDLNVLVVEDNPINLIVTTKMLEQLGISAATAENGLEAIKMAEKNDFDLILMDCQMPEMDGFEATRRILAEIERKPRIFALTASTSHSEREKCKAAGMIDHVSKPFTKRDLSAALGRHFLPEAAELNLDLKEEFVQHSLAKVIDAGKMETFFEIESSGKRDFTRNLLRIFIDHSAKLLSEMNDAAEEPNFVRLGELAHNLKGSTGNAGIKKLFALLEELEEALAKKDLTSVEKQLKEINTEFNDLKQIIRSIDQL
ncbi:MAG: response regulator [Acidobacteria bacterium]|nr:response regulator [Acidobacteriota bacterium]